MFNVKCPMQSVQAWKKWLYIRHQEYCNSLKNKRLWIPAFQPVQESQKVSIECATGSLHPVASTYKSDICRRVRGLCDTTSSISLLFPDILFHGNDRYGAFLDRLFNPTPNAQCLLPNAFFFLILDTSSHQSLTGKIMVNALPFPTVLSTSILPPIFFTIL